MKKVIVDVLGNFGEYKNLIVPTTGRDSDLPSIVETIVKGRFADIPVTFRIVADVVYRKKNNLESLC